MAIPRHRNWYLEDFVKRSIHQDANVLCIGTSFRIPIQNICRQKGLQLRKKAGSPSILEGGALEQFSFPDKSQDLVVFLNKEISLEELGEASRISRMYVAIQKNGLLDMGLLKTFGHLTVTFLPLIAADARGSEENPPVLYVLDVSQAAAEAEELSFKPPIAVTNPKAFEKLSPPEGPSVRDSVPPADGEGIPFEEQYPRSKSRRQAIAEMLAPFDVLGEPDDIFGRRDTPSDPFQGEERVHFLPEDEEVTENGRFAGYTTSGWYFFETDGLCVRGPYSTEILARAGIQDYLDEQVLKQPEDDLKTINKLFASFPPPDPRDVHVGRPPGGFPAAVDTMVGSLSDREREVLAERFDVPTTGRTPSALQFGIQVHEAFEKALTTSLTDEERAFLAKRFGVQEIPEQGPEESSEDYGKKVLGIIEASKANVKRLITNIAEGYISGFYLDEEHAQSALDAVISTMPEGSRASLNQFFQSELYRLTDAVLSEEVASDDT